MLFRWDRYVLTYGLYDQLHLFGGLRDLWLRLWERGEEPEAGEAGEPAAEPGEAAPAPAASEAGGGLLLLATVLVLSAAALGLGTSAAAAP